MNFNGTIKIINDLKMENSKLINRNTMNRPNTRTIGINTEMSLMNIKCIKCLHDCAKFSCFPYYFPFPYPVCNCMIFSHFQNNMMECPNAYCKCETNNYVNTCSSHQCIQNCYSSTSSSSCQNCGSKVFCNAKETVHHTSSNDTVDTLGDRNEEKLNVSLRSSRSTVNEEILEKVNPIDETEYNNTIEDISNSNITKYAAEFLEKNYRSKYGSKQKNLPKSEVPIKDTTSVQNENNGNEKQLLNHLLKPNTSTNKTNIVENDDSDDLIESDNEENTSEDDFSGKTVIRSSPTEIKERPKSSDDRRPARINIHNTTHPQNATKRAQSQNRNPDVEMLMMIKALVNNQYDNTNSTRLNKLLNHIGAEDTGSGINRSTSSLPRKKVANKPYGNLTPKLNENKKPL